MCAGWPNLDSFDVVLIEPRLCFETSVEGGHQSRVRVAVGQPQGVAEFVGCCLKQICT